MTGDGIHRFWAFRIVDGLPERRTMRRDVAARCNAGAAEGFAEDLHEATGCLAQGPVVVGIVHAASNEPATKAIARARLFRVAEVVDVYGDEVIEATALTAQEAPTIEDIWAEKRAQRGAA